MSMDDDRRTPPPRRKPLWPWLLLLVLTLCAIYSYNRVSEIADDMLRNMPDAIIDLFHDLLDSDRRDQGGLRVEVSAEIKFVSAGQALKQKSPAKTSGAGWSLGESWAMPVSDGLVI